MAKTLAELTPHTEEKHRIKGRTFRMSGSVGFRIGDIIELPTEADIDAENGIDVEWIDETDPDTGYYVRIAVRVNGGDWMLVPSGAIARLISPLNEKGEPVQVRWPKDNNMKPTYRIGSDDPFSKVIRRGGDIADTAKAAIRELRGGKLQCIDALPALIKDFNGGPGAVTPKEVFRFKVVETQNVAQAASQNQETSPAQQPID